MTLNRTFLSTSGKLSFAFFLFIIAALFVRSFLLAAGVVDGLSMFPTFQDNERILIEKVTLLTREPQRGDIVQVVHKPNGMLLVKRIIGLPGETIRIRKNAVHLLDADGNEVLLEEPYLPEGTLTRMWDGKPATFGPFAEHEYFVLGDNRQHSRADSRLLGPIPRQWIYGNVYSLIPF
ncbi:signal peptidase I [Candidatus Kaiserbacteria bacterium RIFCSPHIGHO2_02_FULL_49_34]|uniref:Signal peptidase I n=1 Tax=Candidatus Kaiserbacteria bacterium RIFCSPHIGHO2_02_FULL_49_34 TaxID=1798491 RepID=A0A1F6DJQ3_9BACT|nr:MAG: signal peptidase I [Candidatus Kaiserbacteria bacterium RIFCSPHIGHO2_02_FULL_49_34]